jgi:hypothetical protein
MDSVDLRASPEFTRQSSILGAACRSLRLHAPLGILRSASLTYVQPSPSIARARNSLHARGNDIDRGCHSRRSSQPGTSLFIA